jgi:hypothetical protein
MFGHGTALKQTLKQAWVLVKGTGSTGGRRGDSHSPEATECNDRGNITLAGEDRRMKGCRPLTEDEVDLLQVRHEAQR